ncbi:cell adhesion molecule 4 [Huso huso]|uniref:Cell adhesion molecule 4 n=1 Tax=Huso huso TaxID=61971 RepID=A0ABR0YC40_HUSHU
MRQCVSVLLEQRQILLILAHPLCNRERPQPCLCSARSVLGSVEISLSRVGLVETHTGPVSRFGLVEMHTGPVSRIGLVETHTGPVSRFGLVEMHTGPVSRFGLGCWVVIACCCLAFSSQAVQAENVTVTEGGQAEINCKLQSYDGSIVVIQNPHRQTLFFNGTRALKDERFQMVQFTPRLVKIVLSNVRVEDEGGYFCQLYTDATLHQVATLTVLVPPAEPEVEVKEQVVEAGVMELTCIAPRSKPPATLRWYRDRREIPGVTSQQDNDKTSTVVQH